MKNCEMISRVSCALIFLAMFCMAGWVGCDAGKPRNAAPIVEQPPVPAQDSAPAAEPSQEQQRDLVEIGRNVSGKADFAEGGDRHIMAPILVPLGQYFSVRERTVFEMQIPHAMNLYKAANNNKPPASHDEFMREIIAANSINLPSLRNPDDQYQYDPESGELKISTVRK